MLFLLLLLLLYKVDVAVVNAAIKALLLEMPLYM